MIEPFISIGTPIIVAFIGVMGSCLVVWLNKRLGQIDDAAAMAASLAEPTGNGFAAYVTEALERIETKQEDQSRTFAADIGGIRSEIRAERMERITLAQTFSNFIERSNK